MRLNLITEAGNDFAIQAFVTKQSGDKNCGNFFSQGRFPFNRVMMNKLKARCVPKDANKHHIVQRHRRSTPVPQRDWRISNALCNSAPSTNLPHNLYSRLFSLLIIPFSFHNLEVCMPNSSVIPTFELFAFWRTSATYRVRVALNLKGLTAHERIINLDVGEQNSEEFLKINPMGAIPALVEPGHAPLTQSLAILEFLDEFQPSPALLPSDLHGRARVRSLAAMLAADTHPLITPRVKKYLVSSAAAFDDAAWRAWQIQWFSTGLAAVEQRLASESQTGIFCHGDTPTTADIVLSSIVVMTRLFKITPPNTPTIDRIMQACDAHAAFAKAQPARQAGAPA